MNFISRPLIVYLTAGLISLVLSLYAFCHLDVVNPDAICYLQSAQTMQQGLYAAMHLCAQSNWPLYSGLIYLLAQISHLGVMNSAYLLNSALSLISVLAFIAIIQFLNKKPRVLWLAAFVILMAHEFNALRQDVIRDHGFMAFYLLSILFMLQYFHKREWRYAIGWSASLVMAALFRIEGAVFLLLLPFLTWFDTRTNFFSRIRSFLKLYVLALCVITALIIYLLIHPSQDLSRINELLYQLQHAGQNVWQKFLFRADLLAKNVLTPDLAQEARLIYLLTLLSWYVVEVVTTFSLIYTLLVIYAWWKRVSFSDRYVRLILWGYIIVNLVITLVFLADHLFLSKRYLMALTLVLMLWVPLALNHLIERWHHRKALTMLVFVLISLSSLGGVYHFGYSKAYIRDAGEWLALNIPFEAKLYSNDYQLMYYSKHFGNTIFQKGKEFSNLKEVQWRTFDYLALRINKHNPETNDWVQHQIPLSPIKTFYNRRGDEVVIYKIGGGSAQ